MANLESLIIEGTINTPRINFDVENSVFEITGKSMPEDSVDFYMPIMDWVDEFAIRPVSKAKFKVKLLYFNTTSSKMILEIIKKIGNAGADVKIDWYYYEDDEDMEEVGEHLQSILGEDCVTLIGTTEEDEE